MLQSANTRMSFSLALRDNFNVVLLVVFGLFSNLFCFLRYIDSPDVSSSFVLAVYAAAATAQVVVLILRAVRKAGRATVVAVFVVVAALHFASALASFLLARWEADFININFKSMADHNTAYKSTALGEVQGLTDQILLVAAVTAFPRMWTEASSEDLATGRKRNSQVPLFLKSELAARAVGRATSLRTISAFSASRHSQI